MSWDRELYQPIIIPGKRKALVTVRDAAIYITSLPEAERGAEHWRPAAVLLKLKPSERSSCITTANS
jgi:hypothetical protein